MQRRQYSDPWPGRTQQKAATSEASPKPPYPFDQLEQIEKKLYHQENIIEPAHAVLHIEPQRVQALGIASVSLEEMIDIEGV
jgi:hypothetical protein